MRKINVTNPIVEIDGDEMARIMWRQVRDELIDAYLDMELLSFDLSLEHRNATQDQVTVKAAEAIEACGVGIKCATINPDQERAKEFNLTEIWKSPNGTIRSLLGGVIFREPIICRGVPSIVPRWTKPIIVGRHGFGDIYRGAEFRIPGKGRLTVRFEGEEGTIIEREVFAYPGPGVALAIYNLDDSFRDYARACLRCGLERALPVVFSTKNTVLKLYDERFKQIFQEVFDAEFRDAFERRGLTYEHRLIDDMVAFALKSEGGFLWACKNYDGDVQSDFVAQGFGSLGLMTSILVARDGTVVMTEAAHGTITRHYREYQAGKSTSTNPSASMFAWN